MSIIDPALVTHNICFIIHQCDGKRKVQVAMSDAIHRTSQMQLGSLTNPWALAPWVARVPEDWRWETRTGEPHRNLTVPRSAVPSCDTLVSAPFTPWHRLPPCGAFCDRTSYVGRHLSLEELCSLGHRKGLHAHESHETSLLCFGKA